ncbi:TPA: hypothetical protein RUZ19_003428 [Vibrio cholerae]|nr:hypothetical protein [Vibrio cholerae]EGR0744215.1 hypothetical protein [Vibrio cholerae]EGR0757230.1 hypothetical protein [Vibrio cholerae]EGR0820832.1 hypothetical protein [Vibrio cholerae]EGR1037930.1 hypothetical protein [Vibrio cholerae]EGR2241046.1 hypothetical protein [Vibrio cholerae]
MALDVSLLDAFA